MVGQATVVGLKSCQEPINGLSNNLCPFFLEAGSGLLARHFVHTRVNIDCKSPWNGTAAERGCQVLIESVNAYCALSNVHYLSLSFRIFLNAIIRSSK